MLREYITENFASGLVDNIEDKAIPQDAASKVLNWLTKGDRIELSGGYTIVGDENTGTGKITGLHVGQTVSADKQPLRTRKKKLEYYDVANDIWGENGSDVLGDTAEGEDVSMTEHISIAGYYTYISSPNSGLFKVHNNFPSLNKNVFSEGTNFKGYIKAINNRSYMWNTHKGIKNFLNGSHKDTQDEYTLTSNEVIGTGDGATATFSNTLTNITGNRTALNVVVTDGTETFNDNKDGTLTGDAGGTGTINYMTGAVSVTFAVNVANSQNVTCTYEYEDSNSTGITNFGNSTPRVANEGFGVPQATGGDLLNVMPYDQNLYCLHETASWLFLIDETDLSPLNEIYREKLGIKNWRGAVATGDGIYFIDTSNASRPRFKLLRVNLQNTKVKPVIISYNIDLRDYDFTDSVSYEWDQYILFTGRDKRTVSTVPNRLFAFHKEYKSFDVIEYYISCFAEYNGELWAGDSSTDNVMRLFDGFSANGSIINNYWEGALSQVGIDELKKFKRLIVQGEIGKNQRVKVYLAYDEGAYIEIGEIDGSGTYVTGARSVTVASQAVAKDEVGGGSPTQNIQKNFYNREFRVQSPKFDRVKIKFVAQDVGYVSVSRTNFWDIRLYGQKTLKAYRQTL